MTLKASAGTNLSRTRRSIRAQQVCRCSFLQPHKSGGIVLDAQQVAIQGRSTHGYEDFHVERDTDERETHLDEFVGPQLDTSTSLIQQCG